MNTNLYTRHVMDLGTKKETRGIAVVAHDACKQGMLDWARSNRDTLSSYVLYTTGTTGAVLSRELDLSVPRLLYIESNLHLASPLTC